MTRENAIKIVEKKLNAAGLGEAIKISNSRTGTHGEAQCIYIDPIPVKGNSKLIKKLKDMPDFYGYTIILNSGDGLMSFELTFGGWRNE